MDEKKKEKKKEKRINSNKTQNVSFELKKKTPRSGLRKMEGGILVRPRFIQFPLKIRPREKLLGFEIPLFILSLAFFHS